MNSSHESITSLRITQESTRSIIRSDVETAAVNLKGRAANSGTLLKGYHLLKHEESINPETSTFA